ncbi:MAG: DUF3738 domain-containing protein [Chitinophagaceae bacterium]
MPQTFLYLSHPFYWNLQNPLAYPVYYFDVPHYHICPTVLFKDAFEIKSESRVIYEVNMKKICDFSNKSTLLCFDILVNKSDDLKKIFQKTLNEILPVKGRVENREQEVYVLKKLNEDSLNFKPSTSSETMHSFSGRGFNGKAITINVFAEYLSNELGKVVVDETDLKGKYDIKTENVLRSKEEVINSINKIGFKLEIEKRVIPILIIY